MWHPLPTAMGRMLGLALRPLVKPSDGSLCHPWLLQKVPMGPGTLTLGESQWPVVGKAKSLGLLVAQGVLCCLACMLERKVLRKGREPSPYH